MKKTISRIADMLFILLIGFLTVYIIFSHIDVKDFMRIISKSDSRFFILGILCVFGYWGIEVGIIHHLLGKVYSNISPWVSVKAVMVGQYYSHLTPFASGSQPMQVLYMGRDGVSVANSGAVLVSKFLLFQITVTIYAFITALFRLTNVIADLKQASAFVVIGLSINMVGLVAIVAMAYRPKFIKIFLNSVIYLLHHIKVIKNPDEKYDAVRHSIEEYLESLAHLTKNKGELAAMFAASALQVTIFFTIPWLVYLGLGLSGVDYLHVVSMAALLYIAVAFIPIPGAAGASELGFTVILGSIFTSAYTGVGLLLWRGISFYFSFIFCGIFTLFIHIFCGNVKKTLHKKYN